MRRSFGYDVKRIKRGDGWHEEGDERNKRKLEDQRRKIGEKDK